MQYIVVCSYMSDGKLKIELDKVFVNNPEATRDYLGWRWVVMDASQAYTILEVPLP